MLVLSLVQGFPQVLITLEDLFKIWWEGISQYIEGAWGAENGDLKIYVKSFKIIYEGVYLLNLLTISLQAWNLTKNKVLHTSLKRRSYSLGKIIDKYLWRSSFFKVTDYKPVSLQLYWKWTSSYIFFKDFSWIWSYTLFTVF